MKLRYLAGLSLLLVGHIAFAEEEGSIISEWLKYDNSKLPAPLENEFTLPDLAKLKQWYIYPMDKRMGPAQVEIAADSVSSGKDKIIRYAIAITPKGGVRNVLFEGLECDTARYRDYAVGTPELTWSKIINSKWKPGLIQLRNVWQGQLLNDFCSFSTVTEESAQSIINDIKKGQLASEIKK